MLQKHVLIILLCCLFSIPASSAPQVRGPLLRALGLGISKSPDDIPNQLHQTREKPDSLVPLGPDLFIVAPWQRFTDRVHKELGLGLGMAYTALYQRASLGDPYKQASSGDYDFLGHWKLYEGETTEGTLAFEVEARHRITALAPNLLDESIHTVVGTTSGFNIFDPALSQLWWQQNFINYKAGIRFGKIDLTDIFNTYAFDSQKQGFLNEAFTRHPANEMPENGIGFAVGGKVVGPLFILAGMGNANGEVKRSGVNSVLKEGEFYKAIEIGVAENPLKTQKDNAHIVFWKIDARKKEHEPSDQGIAVLTQYHVTPLIMVFGKFDYSRGRTTPYKRLVTAGAGIYKPFNQPYTLLGIAVGWGRPSNYEILHEDHEHHEALKRNEAIAEAFYRIQLTHRVQITPDLQFIHNQPVNGKRHIVSVFSLRFRISA